MNWQPRNAGSFEEDIEHVDQADELTLWRIPHQEAYGLAPGAHLPGIAGLERPHDELVLALEMLVEGRLRDAGFGKNPVETDGVDAMEIEEMRCDPHESAGALLGNGGEPQQLAHALRSLETFRHAESLTQGFTSSQPGGDRE
jgi:hypothetical protein